MVGQAHDIGVPVVFEIGGAIVLGLVIGLPAAFLSGRIEQGEPLQVEALAIGFLTAGLAVWFGVSFLMAGMVVGALIVNLARHHTRAFHEIEHVQWPFMIVFFILAGAALELGTLDQLGLMGVAFIALRVISRLLGGWLGAAISSVPHQERQLYGAALMPQAGVAIGMALLAGQALPVWKEQIIGLTIGATVFFELVGPFATLWAVRRSL
jgi:Kef-type K+ transport system membrane component KefB